jgi:L-threonylcarbamoyladenylate synthase
MRWAPVTAKICSIEDHEALEAALDLLRAGAPIAFPTDTVYGVGAAGLDAQAVLRLYDVKDRPRHQAIPLLLADTDDLRGVCPMIPPIAEALARRHWPGGLTLVVPAASHLPAELLAGGSTVAVRIPAHAVLRDLIRRLGQPLAATSANLHGRSNPASAEDVAADLGPRIQLILDGGRTPGDVPSTIVDVTGDTPRVLRQGVVRVEL